MRIRDSLQHLYMFPVKNMSEIHSCDVITLNVYMCDIRLFCYEIHWYICFKTLSKLNIPFFVNIPSTKLLNKCDEKGLVFKGATAISLSELYLNILISLTNHFKKQLGSIKHGKFYTEFLSLNQNKYYTSLSWKFQHQQMFKIFKIKKYRAKNRFKKCAMSSLQICFFSLHCSSR